MLDKEKILRTFPYDSGLVQQQKKILIIDDEQDIAATLQMNLEDNGLKADSYTDPIAAYENFRDGQYDLVLMDIKMPVFDGFLLYQKIRMKDNRIKICFLTATEFYDEKIRKEYGVGDFKQEYILRKPIQIKDLVRKIKKLVESD